MAGLKQKIARGAVWTLVEDFGTKGVRFFVSMILARLLTPNDYGSIALITVFMAIGGVIADSGLGKALIQKKDATDLDFNSMFYASLALSGTVYAILFFCAPLVGSFYRSEEVVPILRVFSLSLIFSAINGVQNAELMRKMRFDISCKIGIAGSLVSAASGVLLAYLGWGPWAIVISSLICSVVVTILKWAMIAWRPQLVFSFSALRGLFNYGWKLTVASLLETSYQQLSSLFIGRFYSKSDLAYVNRGQAMPSLLMGSINGMLGRVTFPALVQMQDDTTRVRDSMRRIVAVSTFLVFPLMLGLGICAEDVVRVLYGKQWLEAVPYVRLSCFSFALWPMHTVNLNAIYAVGRSDIILTLSAIKKVMCFVGLFASVPFGPWWMMAASSLIIGPISLLVNVYPNKKLLGYTFWMMMRDVMPCATVCAAMGAVVVGVRFCCVRAGLEPSRLDMAFVLLVVQAACGAGVYLALSYGFRLKAFTEYVLAIKAIRSK